MATARSADLGAVDAIRCFADGRVGAARLVLVDGETLREAGVFYRWSIRSVDDFVGLAWAARERAGPPPATCGRRAKKASA
jgi:hypothetical protein